MRIIKQGVPPSEKKAVLTCYACKSELEYTAQDLTYNVETSGDQRDSSYRLRCPICNTNLMAYPPR